MPSWAPTDTGGKGGGNGGVSGGGATGGVPGSGAPGAGAAPTTGRRGGIAIDFRRGKTSQEMLKIDWVYPVWKPKGDVAPSSNNTVVTEREHALPLNEAYELIADGDKRPLLVLRECELCQGTDHALLSRSLDNDQTVLLTHWFRCVKLPPNVLDGKHPFYNLFKQDEDGKALPHLYIASFDGSNRMPMPGDQSQTELWKTMFDVLEREYRGDAKKRVKDLRALLGRMDSIDAMEQELKARIDKETEKHGPKSDKLAKIQKEIEGLQGQRDELVAKAKELRDMALAPATAEAAPAAQQTGAGGN